MTFCWCCNSSHETHELAAIKDREDRALARAFGIDHSRHKEGDAFNRELQAERTAAKKEEREQAKEERVQRAQQHAVLQAAKQAELDGRLKLQAQIEKKKAEATELLRRKAEEQAREAPRRGSEDNGIVKFYSNLCPGL